jgi:hypothetical protein
MTIDPYLLTKNQWVLGRNRREVDASTQYGHQGARRFDFDGFWTGEQWTKGKRLAIRFDSESAALEYLETHLALMEAPRSPRR